MVRKFPVAYGFALAAVLDALIVSGLLPWDETMKAAAITIVTALFTLGSALMARPIEVGLVSATLTTIVTALAAFNVNLDNGVIQTWLTAIVAAAGLLTHNIVSPPGGVLDRDPTDPAPIEPVQ